MTQLEESLPKYLRKSYYGVYVFRKRVPRDLRPVLRKREICRSLNTRDLRRALELSKIFEVDIERAFDAIRRRSSMKRDEDEKIPQSPSLPELTEKDIDEAYEMYRELSMHKIEVGKISVSPQGTVTLEGIKYDSKNSIEDEERALGGMIAQAVKYSTITPQQPNTQPVQPVQVVQATLPPVAPTQPSIEHHQVVSPQSSQAVSAVHSSVVQSNNNVAVNHSAPAKGKLNQKLAQPIQLEQPLPSESFVHRPVVDPNVHVPLPKSGQTALLSTVYERYCNKQQTSKKWNREAAASNLRISIQFFLDLYGDRYVHTYTYEEAEDFLECFRRMPKNWKRNPTLKHLSFDQAVEKAVELNIPAIKEYSVSLYLIQIKALFSYAKKHRYTDDLIFEAVEIDAHAEKGQPWTEVELKVLFDESNFQKFQFRGYPSRYWAPIIAAWSGFRLAEIFQLTVDDVYELHGFWVFCLHDVGDKTLKNSNSRRILPIHQQLIDFGLLDFVAERRKDLTSKNLFVEDKNVGAKSGNAFSTAFGKYIRKLAPAELVNEGYFAAGKVMHAFRHLFIKELKRRKIPRETAQQLTGHVGSKTAYDNYGIDPFLAESEVIEQLTELSAALQELRIIEYFPPLKTYSEMRSSS